jgi:tellurite resistance protein TehA-like permease
MESVEIRGNKTTNDLLREAAWFVLYTVIAMLVLIALMAIFWFIHPNPDSAAPKILFTLLALLVPMLVGFGIARIRPDSVAGYIWISALLFFLVVSVYTLDLPTGNGLCNDCGAIDKLWRTFFSIDHGSGLLGGDGLVWGSWFPLSMIGYAVGAKVSNSME